MLDDVAFNEIMARITSCWGQRDFSGAYTSAQVILTKGNAEMKSQCLLLCGMIKDAEGLSAEARKMWIAGVSNSKVGTFVRYSLENAIGESYLKSKDSGEALLWCRSAMQTCLTGDEFSCNQALSLFLELVRDELPEQDRLTIIAAIEKSWRVLEFPGKPDLSDPPKAISELNKRSRDLFEEATR